MKLLQKPFVTIVMINLILVYYMVGHQCLLNKNCTDADDYATENIKLKKTSPTYTHTSSVTR